MKRKYVARPGIEPRTPDLRVWCPTDCATRPGALPFGRILYHEPCATKKIVQRLLRGQQLWVTFFLPFYILPCSSFPLFLVETKALTVSRNSAFVPTRNGPKKRRFRPYQKEGKTTKNQPNVSQLIDMQFNGFLRCNTRPDSCSYLCYILSIFCNAVVIHRRRKRGGGQGGRGARPPNILRGGATYPLPPPPPPQ